MCVTACVYPCEHTPLHLENSLKKTTNNVNSDFLPVLRLNAPYPLPYVKVRWLIFYSQHCVLMIRKGNMYLKNTSVDMRCPDCRSDVSCDRRQCVLSGNEHVGTWFSETETPPTPFPSHYNLLAPPLSWRGISWLPRCVLCNVQTRARLSKEPQVLQLVAESLPEQPDELNASCGL